MSYCNNKVKRQQNNHVTSNTNRLHYVPQPVTTIQGKRDCSKQAAILIPNLNENFIQTNQFMKSPRPQNPPPCHVPRAMLNVRPGWYCVYGILLTYGSNRPVCIATHNTAGRPRTIATARSTNICEGEERASREALFK